MPITEAFIESLSLYPYYTWTVLAVVVLGMMSFVGLSFVSAPYGRHMRPGWGPTLNATTSWVLMEAPSPIAFGIVYFKSEHAFEPVPLILCGMYMLHYVYRAFIYPFRMRGGHKRKPIFTGVVAFAFNTANGWTNAFAITVLAPHLLSNDWLTDPRFIIGILVFMVGWAINQQSDSILFQLREPGEMGYKIPQGGLYRWLSSPNYFGEIIEWIGFALAAWTVPAWVFAWFTGTNLIPRAFSNHRWYQDHFSQYPRKRRAIFPFFF